MNHDPNPRTPPDADQPPQPAQAPPAAVAVAFPCRNEAPALPELVAAWRAALPDAALHVFDNNSTDGTGDLARSLGVFVEFVPEPGKGRVVRAIFERLRDYPVVLMVDGDSTYDAPSAPALVAPLLENRADMTIGARVPDAALGAMSPLRGIGNRLIRIAFRIAVGPGTRDLLSGYRGFNQAFRQAFLPRSTGFEIETELTCRAIAGNFRILEIPTPYHPRAAGTASKLRAFRDGARILRAIVANSARLRPARFAALLGVAALLLAGAAAALAALALR